MNQTHALESVSKVSWLILALAGACGLCVLLFGVRVLFSNQITHAYLIWNLFLAGLPAVFALLAWKWRRTTFPCLMFGGAWLLFFPNAPYLITDLVHLRPIAPVPFWFDIILFQSFICLGLLLAFLSLYWMQGLVALRSNRLVSWIFLIAVIGLTGFGLYLGRVERWNSWDLFVRPLDLLSEAFALLLEPRRRRTGLYSLLYATFLLIAYVFFYSLTHWPGRVDLTDEHSEAAALR